MIGHTDIVLEAGIGVAFGNKLGLDMIITDHHTVGPEIPPALAAINPKQTDCTYPFKDLAGVGLAHKLAQALIRSETLNGYGNRAELSEDAYSTWLRWGPSPTWPRFTVIIDNWFSAAYVALTNL